MVLPYQVVKSQFADIVYEMNFTLFHSANNFVKVNKIFHRIIYNIYEFIKLFPNHSQLLYTFYNMAIC